MKYLFFTLFFLISCGSINSDFEQESNSGIVEVHIGYNNSKTTTIPSIVKSAKLVIFKVPDLITPFKTLISKDLSKPFIFIFEGISGPSYNLFAYTYDNVDSIGNSIYNGKYVNLTFASGVKTIIELNLMTTDTASPTTNSIPPSTITGNGVYLQGDTNPNNIETVVNFQWGTTLLNLNNSTPIQTVGNGSINVNRSQFITGLNPNTQYFYRIVAINGSNIVNGSTISFKTLGVSDVSFWFPTIPSITSNSLSVSSITSISAIISASINPEGSNTRCYIQWGLDLTYGNTSIINTIPSGFVDKPVSFTLTGLEAVTLYHYRFVIFNSEGILLGNDETFTSI